MKRDWRIAGMVLLLAPLALAAGAQEMPLARYFGFGPIDILKVDEGIQSLTVRDFNGDGLNDIAVLNNRQNRIELFLRRVEPKSAPASARLDAADINRLAANPNFASSPILLTARPANLAAGDFNADGKVDLAFYGDPAAIYLLIQEPGESDDLRWQPIREIRIDDGLTRPNCLAAGDLNGDGRDDIALAADSGVCLLFQNDQGEFGEPRLLPAEGKIQEIRVGMFNDDPHTDLLIVTADPERPVTMRFGYGRGEFSPLVRYECESPVSVIPFDLFGGAEQELLYVEKRTGRLMARRFTPDPVDPDAGDFHSFASVYPFTSLGDAAMRDLICGDFNGDGRRDIAVTQPDAAKVSLYLQDPVRGICAHEEYPAFYKTDTLRAADVDQDGRDELILLSVEERAVGVSRFDDGRLTFPQLVEIDGQPLALDVADVDGDGWPEGVYVTRGADDRISLGFHEWIASGVDLSSVKVDLDNVQSNPDGIRVMDISADGKPDVILFRMYDDPVLVLQAADQTFETIADGGKQSGLIKAASPQNLVGSDVDGDGRRDVLVARQNFARHLRLEDGAWQIVDQFNAAGRDDQVLTAQTADLDGDGRSEILLLDARKNQLQILRADETDTYRVTRRIDVGPWVPGKPLKMLWEPFGDHSQLLLFDGAKFALLDFFEDNQTVLPAGLEPIFTQESTVEDGRYFTLAGGDLNADGRCDLVVVEYRKNHIEILTLPPGSQTPVLAARFRVFEEKSYSDSTPRAAAEPRELTIADLNGDGLDDLVTIIHDRVIIYPQDR